METESGARGQPVESHREAKQSEDGEVTPLGRADCRWPGRDCGPLSSWLERKPSEAKEGLCLLTLRPPSSPSSLALPLASRVVFDCVLAFVLGFFCFVVGFFFFFRKNFRPRMKVFASKKNSHLAVVLPFWDCFKQNSRLDIAWKIQVAWMRLLQSWVSFGSPLPQREALWSSHLFG